MSCHCDGVVRRSLAMSMTKTRGAAKTVPPAREKRKVWRRLRLIDLNLGGSMLHHGEPRMEHSPTNSFRAQQMTAA